MVEVKGAHRLSPAKQEMLRLRVIAALESGQVEGYRQAAEVFGVSVRSVGTWWQAYQRLGRNSLVARRERRPGPAELISPEDRNMLFAAMVDYTAEELLISGPLWTRPAVVELIGLVVGVDMTEQGVGLWLRRHGFTPQRPARRAYEQQPASVPTWLDEDYPAIESRAKAENAAIAWVDQCGLRSDATPPGRSYSARIARTHPCPAVWPPRNACGLAAATRTTWRCRTRMSDGARSSNIRPANKVAARRQ